MGELAVLSIRASSIFLEVLAHLLLVATSAARLRSLSITFVTLLLFLLSFITLAIPTALVLMGAHGISRWKGSPLRTFSRLPYLSLAVVFSELSLLESFCRVSEKFDVLLTVAFREPVPGVPVDLKALDFLDFIGEHFSLDGVWDLDRQTRTNPVPFEQEFGKRSVAVSLVMELHVGEVCKAIQNTEASRNGVLLEDHPQELSPS